MPFLCYGCWHHMSGIYTIIWALFKKFFYHDIVWFLSAMFLKSIIVLFEYILTCLFCCSLFNFKQCFKWLLLIFPVGNRGLNGVSCLCNKYICRSEVSWIVKSSSKKKSKVEKTYPAKSHTLRDRTATLSRTDRLNDDTDDDDSSTEAQQVNHVLIHFFRWKIKAFKHSFAISWSALNSPVSTNFMI